MPELPLVGVTAVIAGMAAFNRDAAMVEGGLLRIGRASDNLEAQTAGAFGGTESAFGTMAGAVATGATLVTGALLLGAGAAIKFAADFEQGMALTKALSGATTFEISQLTGTIEDLARKGTVGLSDLSEGARDLARSGVTIPEIMGGALKAVQDLTIASGGEISLDSAAKLVANSMHAFGIEAKDVDKITTAAAVVAQNSSATFTDFGTAVAIAGASFKSVGFTIEDLAIAETLLTNKGVTASTAATALRGVIQRLEKPSKDAAAVMKEYGIHLFDSAGKAVPFRDLLLQLNTAFSDEAVAAGNLTEKQRDVAVSTIGLQRTGAAFLVLANEGTVGFDRLAASFGRLKAEDLVEIVLKPLNAQAEIAWNNVTVLARAFGSTFLPELQKTTGGLVLFLQNISTTDMLNFGTRIGEVAKEIGASLGPAVQAATKYIQDLLAGFGLTSTAGDLLKATVVGIGIVVLGVLVPPILAGAAALAVFALQIGIVALAVERVSGFVADSATHIAVWAQDMGLGGRIVANAFHVTADLALSVGALLRGDFSSAAAFANLAIHDFGDGLRENGGRVLDELGKKLDEVGAMWAPWAAGAGPAGVVVSESITGVHQVVEGLAFLLQGNFAAASKDAEAAMGSFGRATAPVVTAIREGLAAAFNFIVNTVWPAVLTKAKEVGDAFDKVGTFVHDLDSKLRDLGVYDRLSAAWDNAVSIGAHLRDIGVDLLATIGILAQPFLDLATAADKAHGSLGPTADALDSIAASAKVAADSLVIMTGVYNAISGAIEGTIRFFNEVLKVIIDVTSTMADMLGVGNDLRQAWWNLEAAGQALSQAFTNIGLILSDLNGPIVNATGGIDFMRLAAQLLGGAIGGPLALAIKGVSLIIEATTAIIREIAVEIVQFSTVARQVQLDLEAMGAAIASGLNTALAAVGPWVDSIIGAIRGFIPLFIASGGDLGLAIATGLSGALVAAVGRVAASAAALATSAIDAARAAVGAHSPSRDFELLGEDMGEGLNLGLLNNIPKAKAAAKTYGDSILQEMAVFVDNVEKASRDIGDKLLDIATKIPKAIADIIDKGNHDIAVAIDQAQAALDRLGGTQANTDSWAAKERAVTSEVNAEKDAFKQHRQDEEEAFKHTKDLIAVDTAYRRGIDLENAKWHAAVEDAKTQKDLNRVNDAHIDALKQLEVRRTDDRNAANQRFTDQLVETNRRRGLDEAEREFMKTADAKITQFKQDQLVQERDTKIKTISDAENTNIQKVQQSADDQRALLLRSYNNRIHDLREQLLDKIPPITGAAADVLQDFMDKVETETAATTQSIVDSMGTAVTESVDAVGADATQVLGPVGVVPRAAAATTAAFTTATGAADDLHGDKTGGLVSATDAATQISFVLQQLDDKMPHLVAGIYDLVAAINELHDKTITVTVNQQNNANAVHTQSIASLGARLPSFEQGGLVPGPLGTPMLAIVHSGEFIAGLHTEAARWARELGGSQVATNKYYNYNVNAQYANTQSEASVALDMKALVALARG